jgi:hypothetical protein
MLKLLFSIELTGRLIEKCNGGIYLKNKYRTWLIGFILGICVFSLVLNVFLIHSKITFTNQTKYAATYAMEQAIAEINVANQYIITNKQYSLAMLAEAGGTLYTLQNIVPDSSENVRNHLNNVAYYLHSQATAASLNGLSQFINNAV